MEKRLISRRSGRKKGKGMGVEGGEEIGRVEVREGIINYFFRKVLYKRVQ